MIQITHLPHRETFLGKLTVIFAYLLCPIILLNIWKRSLEWIVILKVAKMLANVVPNSKLPIFPRKEIVFENWLTSLLPTYWAPIILQHFKQILRADIRYKVSYNFGLNWVQIAYFLGKLTVTIVYLLISILLQHFKKVLREQIIRLDNFGPNWPLLQKGIFLENWLILLMFNYCTPLY